MASSLPNTIQPDFEINKIVKPRVLQTDFGDGYSQRTADGINNVVLEYDLVYTGLNADINELDNHFIERAGYQSFTISGSWCPSVSYKWICQEWSVTLLNNTAKQLSAKITQVFDL